MQLGASPLEIALVVYLMALIGIAPKVGKIGEVIGGLFERRGPGDGAIGEVSQTPCAGGRTTPHENGGAGGRGRR